MRLLSVFLIGLLASAPALAEQCGDSIKSLKAKEAVKRGLEKITRSESAYQNNLKYISHKEPAVCDIQSVQGEWELWVNVMVTVSVYYEGDTSETIEETPCYVNVSSFEGDWEVDFLLCEDLGVEEDI